MKTTAPVTLAAHESAQIIIATGQFVEPGETVEVPTELAGRPPDGDDPGEGLLAQHEKWLPGTAAKPLTIKEVLNGVDGDPDRARAAITDEQARDKPRPKLIEQLAAIAGGGDDGAPAQEGES